MRCKWIARFQTASASSGVIVRWYPFLIDGVERIMKDDQKDVRIPCFGDVRGCLVPHCDVAGLCNEMTKMKELANAQRG